MGKIKGKLRNGAIYERDPITIRDLISGEAYSKIKELNESDDLLQLAAKTSRYKNSHSGQDLLDKIVAESEFAPLASQAYEYVSIECGKSAFEDFESWLVECGPAVWEQKHNTCPAKLYQARETSGDEGFLRISAGYGLLNYLLVP